MSNLDALTVVEADARTELRRKLSDLVVLIDCVRAELAAGGPLSTTSIRHKAAAVHEAGRIWEATHDALLEGTANTRRGMA